MRQSRGGGSRKALFGVNSPPGRTCPLRFFSAIPLAKPAFDLPGNQTGPPAKPQTLPNQPAHPLQSSCTPHARPVLSARKGGQVWPCRRPWTMPAAPAAAAVKLFLSFRRRARAKRKRAEKMSARSLRPLPCPDQFLSAQHTP